MNNAGYVMGIYLALISHVGLEFALSTVNPPLKSDLVFHFTLSAPRVK